MKHLNETTQKIIDFIQTLPIPIRFESIETDTFVPGILVDRGSLVVDVEKMTYPGDLLHEAGHIALLDAQERGELTGDLDKDKLPGESKEIAVILWTFAAIKHLNIPPEVVFHPAGYQGQSNWHINNFYTETYIGLPLLEWMELAYSPKKAEEKRVKPFPNMVKWMRG